MCVVLIGVRVCFFFNDPATTEIYTYGHTLSLHDALPISLFRRGARRDRDGADRLAPVARRMGVHRQRHADEDRLHRPRLRRRSEEHTSELQSLMRTSYAVFCLKKKTHTLTPILHTLQLFLLISH